jgi:hypothetical protein
MSMPLGVFDAPGWLLAAAAVTAGAVVGGGGRGALGVFGALTTFD